MKLKINRPCPSCKKLDTVTLTKHTLNCSSCSFTTQYCCPLCDSELKNEDFKEDAQGEYFTCSGCKKDIHTQRVQYLINNLMSVSQENVCQYCNGPTVCRSNANIGHRCFFFPKCSGQASLFGAKRESLVFLDFETTGLEAGKDHLIEIGALKIDEDGFEQTFDTFVKSPIPLPEKIIQITKITDEMLIDAPQLSEIITDFHEFIGDSTIVAHNAEFDVPWYIIECQKYDIQLNNNNVICTLKWAQQLKEARCSLGALTKKYKIGHMNSHRALADSGATKELFFIFENLQVAGRPQKKLEDYKTIVNKIQSKRKKSSLIVNIP
ncbi:hypothetical protein DID76_00410 [Candidatus Marinamargulisbacteria bacterium SCGC AG-414-C22]|nr:hypothetical protein DID76_00410 [Candidatus Marinamargulisbacteria bacterium SCGC AG-414-C22]